MGFIFMIATFIMWMVWQEDALIIASGLFAIAYSIEMFQHKYFKNKKDQA